MDKRSNLDDFDNPPLGWQQIDLKADYPVLNRPFDSKNGILLTVKTGNNAFQLYSRYNTSELYTRNEWYGAWYSWKRVNYLNQALPRLNSTKYCNTVANTSQTWLMTVSQDLSLYKAVLVHYAIGDGANGKAIITDESGLNFAIVTGGYTDNWAATLQFSINFAENSISLKTRTTGWTLDQVYVQGIYGFIYK